MNAKIIAVWGAAGSGKTTVAVNLALSLASRNHMVGLISSKLYYGELQNLFGCRIESEQGLYKALSSGDTKNMFTQAGAKSSVFFLAPANDMDAMLLTTLSATSVKDLLEDARMRFDYLIVDCSEEINNPISSIALANAANVFTIHHPSVKACAWYKAVRNLIEMLRIEDKLIHVVNGYDKTCDKTAFLSSLGVHVEYELDTVEKAKIFENSGTPIYLQKSHQTKGYRKTIDAMASLAALG